MAQVEAPANLDRWRYPEGRLITLILIRGGLRISSASNLAFDCLLHDGQGAPYLRYYNTKMERDAAVPIDEELQAEIRAQQRRVLDRWPDGNPHLFPRAKMNADGRHPLSPDTYRQWMQNWLETCEVRDEHGLPVHLTPHQWRRPFATRLINRDVPQEVGRYPQGPTQLRPRWGEVEEGLARSPPAGRMAGEQITMEVRRTTHLRHLMGGQLVSVPLPLLSMVRIRLARGDGPAVQTMAALALDNATNPASSSQHHRLAMLHHFLTEEEIPLLSNRRHLTTRGRQLGTRT